MPGVYGYTLKRPLVEGLGFAEARDGHAGKPGGVPRRGLDSPGGNRDADAVTRGKRCTGL